MTRVITIGAGDLHILYDCGICGGYHPWSWNGDCRDDNNRYAAPEEYADIHDISVYDVEVRSMEERVSEDWKGESQ